MGRSRRNDPETACNDAITQTSMFISLPVASTMWVVAALVSSDFATHFANFDGIFLAPTVTSVLLTSYVINRMFKDYWRKPFAADEYRSPDSRRRTRVLFVTIPMVGVSLVGLALLLLKHV